MSIKDAIQAVIAQGRPSVDKNNKCMYRGPDGLKCSVGHMISDEDYTPELEGADIRSLVEGFRATLNYDVETLSALQLCHDSAAFKPDSFVEEFKREIHKTGNSTLIDALNSI